MGVGAVDAAHVGRGDDALRGEQSAEVHDALHGIMFARFGDEWRDEVARRLFEDSGGLTGGIALDFAANRIGRVARDASDLERTAVDAADMPAGAHDAYGRVGASGV